MDPRSTSPIRVCSGCTKNSGKGIEHFRVSRNAVYVKNTRVKKDV
jgi:hypothetical protein